MGTHHKQYGMASGHVFQVTLEISWRWIKTPVSLLYLLFSLLFLSFTPRVLPLLALNHICSLVALYISIFLLLSTGAALSSLPKFGSCLNENSSQGDLWIIRGNWDTVFWNDVSLFRVSDVIFQFSKKLQNEMWFLPLYFRDGIGSENQNNIKQYLHC